MATVPTKLLSRDVHKQLRAHWAAPLKAAGWKRSKLSPSAWSLSTETDAVSFWVQIDKYGWWEDFGSELTVEFQYDHGTAAELPGDFHNRQRYAAFLSFEDTVAVLEANFSVRGSLPPDPKVAIPGFDPYPNDFRAQANAPAHASGLDLWMRYYRTEHVQWIADFLLPRLDSIARTWREQCRARI